MAAPRIKPPRWLAANSRGRQMFTELVKEWDLGPADRVLLEEACRAANRLERIDRILVGDLDAWMTLRDGDDGAPAIIVINNALAEARQQQTALRGMLASLRPAPAKAPAREDEDAPANAKRGLDEISERIRARRAAATAD